MEDFNNFRLQKISMIVADVLLVVLGVIFAFSGEGPMDPMRFFWVVVSVGLGGVLAFIPFFLEYKIRANLAEYDRSQANLENAERIERVLAEIHEIAAIIARQTDRAEEAQAKTAEVVARLEQHEPAPSGEAASDGEALKTLSASVDALRKDVTQAMESVASADDTAALIGGIEVSLATLTARLEDVQAQLARDAAARRAPADVPPAPASEEDEAVEPSALEEDFSEEPPHHGLKPGDPMPEDVGHDVTVHTSEDKLVEEQVRPGLQDTAEQELEGAEDVPEDLEIKEAALDALAREIEEEAVAREIEAEAAEPEEPLQPDWQEDIGDPDEPVFTDMRSAPASSAEADEDVIEDDWEESDVADSEEPREVSFLDEEVEEEPEESAGDESEAISEEAPDEDDAEKKPAAGVKLVDVPAKEEVDDFGEIELATPPPAGEEELAAEARLDEGSEDAGDEEDAGPEQVNLLDDLPPPRKKPRKSPKGATVLVAQVLIGIGNKPYVRGTGGGLSPHEGVPMEFLEIGKWQWTAPEGDEPISCQIYKNDEVPADGEAIELEPGQRRTVSPTFTA
jgi:hypothetical protein